VNSAKAEFTHLGDILEPVSVAPSLRSDRLDLSGGVELASEASGLSAEVRLGHRRVGFSLELILLNIETVLDE
jgi:hypothetical protein